MNDRATESEDAVDAAREAAVAAYLHAVAVGELPDRDALAAGDPELRAFLARHEQLAELGSWWRLAAGEVLTPTLSIDEPTANYSWELSASAALPNLPGYQVLREVARGGMGIVYEARQTSLNRPVAVKIILHGGLAEPADKRRFIAEAAAAAKLKHPNIVVVHEVGECAGQPFYSMEYVVGESLARLVRRQLPTPKQAAHYVAEVARAVQFAHDNGVLHRDIKPSNVLIDESGRVRVMDFGLAKQIDADDKLTMTGQLLGTPSYMAPEQITGVASEIGPACDVYGLGALLYELLTGQPPFRGANQVETLLAALESEPMTPRQINPAAPRALEMIALKCLEKDPGNRYASAGALAADLNRYLEGESLSISSPNLLDRVVRTLERSKFDREVHEASRLVMHVAWIALAAHVAVFANYFWRAPHPLAGVLGIRLAEVAAMLAVFWPRHAEWYPPRGAAARQLWSIWIGYLVGSLALYLVDYLMTAPGEAFYGLRAYPPMAVLASLAYFLLGSSYWGYCYLIGGLFLALAVAMTQWLPAAPLAFGMCWAASLVLVGVRLRRLTQTGQ